MLILAVEQEIPQQFVEKSVRLQGRVVSLSEGGVLHVDHTPIVSRRHRTIHPIQWPGNMYRYR